MTNKELAEKLRWYGNLAAMGPVDCELPEEACDDLFAAADALEKTHGHWEALDLPQYDWECSVCGGAVCWDEPLIIAPYYCPLCGAKMDRGDLNGQRAD